MYLLHLSICNVNSKLLMIAFKVFQKLKTTHFVGYQSIKMYNIYIEIFIFCALLSFLFFEKNIFHPKMLPYYVLLNLM